MPNHVLNIVKFKNLKPSDIDIILNAITSPISYETYAIDFDKIIPEPRMIEDCSPEFIIPEDERIHPGLEITDERNWFNWYSWHCKYWGTKWNAYEAYTKIGKSYVTFIFQTAWSAPLPIYDKLILLGYDIDIKYADEDWGSNCGKISWSKENGWNIMDGRTDLPNPYKFASNLWYKY